MRSRFPRVELKNRLARGFFRKMFGSFLSEKEIEGHASATARASATGQLVALGYAGGVQTRERLGIFCDGAV